MGNSVQRGTNVSDVANARLARAQEVQQKAAVQSVILPTVAVPVDGARKLGQGSSGTGGINWMEPPEVSGPVSEQQAAAAAERLLFNGATSLAAALGAQAPVAPGPGTPQGPTPPQQPQSPFQNAMGVSGEALAMYGMLLYMEQMSSNAKLDLKAAQGNGAAQANQFKQKEDAWLKERKEQYKAAHPSLIGEIVKDVLTVVAAVADIAEGVGELVAFDPQGLASATSGVAQAVAAGLQIAAQAEQGSNPKEAAKLNKIADDINYAAIGLSVIGGCVDLRNSINAAGKVGDAASDAISSTFSMTDDELDVARTVGMDSFKDEAGVEMDVFSSSTSGEEGVFVKGSEDGGALEKAGAEDGVVAKGGSEDGAFAKDCDETSVSARKKLTKADFEKQIDVATDKLMQNLEKEFKGTTMEKGLTREAARASIRNVVEKAVEAGLKSGDADEVGARAAEHAASSSSWRETFGASTKVRKESTYITRGVKAAVNAGSAATDGATAVILANETHAAGKADVAQKVADFELQFIQFIQNMALKNMQSDTDNQSKARQHFASINSSCMNAMQAAARAI